jgi:hypothetical protein
VAGHVAGDQRFTAQEHAIHARNMGHGTDTVAETCAMQRNFE